MIYYFSFRNTIFRFRAAIFSHYRACVRVRIFYMCSAKLIGKLR